MMQIGQNLAVEKTRAIAEVEAAVEAITLAYMPSPARAAIYMRKEAEAKALLAAVARLEAVADVDYPLLAVDAGLSDMPLEAAAKAVLVKADEWAILARDLESYRRGAKVRIETSNSFQEVRDCLSSLKVVSPVLEGGNDSVKEA